MLRDGQGGDADFAGALRLFEGACLAGHPEACSQIEHTSPPMVPYLTSPDIQNMDEVARALVGR